MQSHAKLLYSILTLTNLHRTKQIERKQLRTQTLKQHAQPLDKRYLTN